MGECGDDVVGLLVRDRQSLDFCLRKKAKQSANEVSGEVVGSIRMICGVGVC